MEGTSAVTAFSAALGSTANLSEKGFEICAVDEQAKSLLQTVLQVAAQLDDARLLRSQKSSHFDHLEKHMFDETFRSTENAIRQYVPRSKSACTEIEASMWCIGLTSRLLTNLFSLLVSQLLQKGPEQIWKFLVGG